MINEVAAGVTDYVEIYNPETTVADLGGWRLTATADSIVTNFVLPAGSSVPPQGFAGFFLNVTTGPAGVRQEGPDLSWGVGAPGSLALLDPFGSGKDFVRWGGSTTTPPLGTKWIELSILESPGNDALGRALSEDDDPADGDRSVDWCLQTRTLLRGNDPCAVWVLDKYGGVHTGGGGEPPPITPRPPYFGFDVARDIEVGYDGTYHVLDAFGGIHSGGGAVNAPPVRYFGYDFAIDMEFEAAGIYVLDKFGGIHWVGTNPPLTNLTPYFGFDIARDLEFVGIGGNFDFYVLDGFGGLHAGGGAVPAVAPTPYFGFDAAVDFEALGPPSSGFYVLDAWGGVHAGNNAPIVTSIPYFGFDVARDLETSTTGLYVLDAFGGIHAADTPSIAGSPYFGFDAAIDLEIR